MVISARTMAMMGGTSAQKVAYIPFSPPSPSAARPSPATAPQIAAIVSESPPIEIAFRIASSKPVDSKNASRAFTVLFSEISVIFTGTSNASESSTLSLTEPMDVSPASNISVSMPKPVTPSAVKLRLFPMQSLSSVNIQRFPLLFSTARDITFMTRSGAIITSAG